MWYMCKDFHLKDNLNTHMIMMYYITENNWNIFRIIKYSVKNVEQKYIPAINRNIMLDVIQPGLSFFVMIPQTNEPHFSSSCCLFVLLYPKSTRFLSAIYEISYLYYTRITLYFLTSNYLSVCLTVIDK